MKQNVHKKRPIFRTWVLLIPLLPFLLLLIFGSVIGPLMKYLGLADVAHYSEFIDLSIQNPKDKKTGFELVSVGDGEATVSKKEKTWDMKEGNGFRAHAGVRLLYASKESGEVVLERMRSRNYPDWLSWRKKIFWWEKDMSMNEFLEKRGWFLFSLSTNRFYLPTGSVETNFGIELISVETNGATIRLSESGKVLYTRNGGFFDIKYSLKGVGRLQLVRSFEKENYAHIRVISAKGAYRQ